MDKRFMLTHKLRTQGKTSTKFRWRKGYPASGWPATNPHKVTLPNEPYRASLDYHDGVYYLAVTPSAHAIQELLTTQESKSVASVERNSIVNHI